MDFILRAFTSYMNANGIDEYSPEIGENMIRYCEETLKVCDSRVSRAKGIVAKLNRLYQGLDGEEALWTDKTVPVELPDSLSKALDSFILHCRHNGNKDTTLHYKRWICSRFLKIWKSSDVNACKVWTENWFSLHFYNLAIFVIGKGLVRFYITCLKADKFKEIFPSWLWIEKILSTTNRVYTGRSFCHRRFRWLQYDSRYQKLCNSFIAIPLWYPFPWYFRFAVWKPWF